MGCAFSSRISSYEYLKIIKKAEKFERQRIFDEIGLSDVDIDKLYKVFKSFDVDDSGKMELGELLVNLGLEESPFATRVFRLFDTDGSSDIDFKEFVLSLWNYCTLTPKTLIEFAFKLFDQDGDGLLRLNDMKAMIKEIYGIKSATDPKLIRMTKEFESKIWMSEIEAINCRQFGELTRNYQQLVFPAFKIQTQMREKVLGPAFWSIHTSYRIREVDGKVLDLPLKTRAYLTFNSRYSPKLSGRNNMAATPLFQEYGDQQTDKANRALQLKSPRLSTQSTIASPRAESRRSSRISPVDTAFAMETIPATPRGDRIQINPNQNPTPQWYLENKSQRQSNELPSLVDAGKSRVGTPRNSVIEGGGLSQRNTPRGERIQVNTFINQTASTGDICSRPVSKYHTPTMLILSSGKTTGSIASPPEFPSPRNRSPHPSLPKLPLVQVQNSVTSESIYSSRQHSARPSTSDPTNLTNRRKSAPLVPVMSPANRYKVVRS